MNEYEKFKKLLEYFVAHLEFCVTDQKVGDGYTRYIKDIKNFNRGGQGHKGQNIQNQIKDWESYTNGDICININPTVYTGRGCYLNWEDTAINVNAVWANDRIVKLKIVKDSYPISNAKDVMVFSVAELGLLDNDVPNDNLKSFFDKFNSLIIDRIKNEQNKREMANIQPYIKLLKEVKNIILTGAPGTGKTFLARLIAEGIVSGKINQGEKSSTLDVDLFKAWMEAKRQPDGSNYAKSTLSGYKGSAGYFSRKYNGLNNVLNKIEELRRIYKPKTPDDTGGFRSATLTLLEEYSQSIPQDINDSNNGINTKISFIQFHPSFDYTDFVEGLRPIKVDGQSEIGFELKNGIFKEFCKKAYDNPNHNYVIIIDEINRAEISSVFGELFFSIDPGYRGIKGIVKTQYSNMQTIETRFAEEYEGGEFFVPENVYVIGTMNDIDRSVESFDFAMRRRFTWKEVTAEQSANNMNLPEGVKARMAKLNEKISEIEGLNDSYHIGGAYFLDINGNARQDYDIIWELRLEPLLKEYLRGMPDEKEKIKILKNAYSA